MIITKYEHACLVVDEGGQQLLIDPGVLSRSFEVPENPIAAVITHIHVDHFDKDLMEYLLRTFNDLTIFTNAEVAAVLGSNERIQVISNGDTKQVGSFSLAFYGTNHQPTHPTAPHFTNTGVMVNDQLYYPGDSFTIPDKPVKVLAVPISGPWLKTAESIDFMLAIKPEKAFPTHDVMLSEDGLHTTNNWLVRYAEEPSIDYKPLTIGQPTTF
jgi:L-ascorbate metabolism protein UlaG (beta-lactamase superfamily)